jgi:hypothetical protein
MRRVLALVDEAFGLLADRRCLPIESERNCVEKSRFAATDGPAHTDQRAIGEVEGGLVGI